MTDNNRCDKCKATFEWHEDRCPVCGHDIGFPLARELGRQKERDALQRRYQEALDSARNRAVEDRVAAFEQAVQSKSRAVIGVWPSFLASFLNDARMLFTSYSLQVAAGSRKPASREDDKRRRGTEGTLFGALAPKICYAALSLDDAGLVSYGDDCFFTLVEAAARARGTLLEENSYTFVQKHKILPGDEIPAGYRAVWRDRHKLAVAKLAGQIDESTTDSAFAQLLLHSDGDRATDKFMEVHIYSGFDNQSVDGVRIPMPENAPSDDRENLKRIRDWARKNNRGYSER
ncbi:MAG: hypothetical protein BECKG1743D_GA0114223_100419 [Candidatus Kentron sp. G]|nr:MAG: hypothetical protein BECKG1743F_GA0114225_100418 [Candidatus Kentron sp. G]VFM96125.1 MAG: hypothetical protein BECKG1743E_GA0114224_100378 [Candidatus Kentron sp. G]VFM98017.1 MAG: hypothetical protein BECKG1743D_GA0114223_100419 [Candidatus Kentron sp. G]